MEETLLTAARRVVRFFSIDMMHGGLISEETQIAFDTLQRQIEREVGRLKRLEEKDGET